MITATKVRRLALRWLVESIIVAMFAIGVFHLVMLFGYKVTLVGAGLVLLILSMIFQIILNRYNDWKGKNASK